MRSQKKWKQKPQKDESVNASFNAKPNAGETNDQPIDQACP